MKNKEELKNLKEEVESVNEKLQELTEEEIAQVSGGVEPPAISPKLVIRPAAHEPKLITPISE